MKVVRLFLWLFVGSCLALTTAAQETPQPTDASVPRLVNFSGRISDSQGKAVPGTAGVTFAIYRDQHEGSPLWLETQNVQADARGFYTVQLGATRSEGLPLEFFASGEARWLGVRVTGQDEQPRVLLLSVPYALKAADAATVGGLPPSAFMLAPPANGAGSSASSASTRNLPGDAFNPALGGGGTLNFVPLWTPDGNTLGNSALFQSGTQLGINTTTPGAALDVNGTVISRGLLQLPSTGTATADGGFSSQPLYLQGSAFNSSTQQAVAQAFQWQTEPAGNNSSNPSGTLNLLYGSGSNSPGETGLNIASNGKITFATGQTFPGTGTITGITAGTGLTGGGTSGNVTLSINIPFANQFYAQLGATNTFTKNQTVNANLTAKQLISTATQGTAPLQVTSTTVVPNLNASLLGGLSASAFQPSGSYAGLGTNAFTGDQNVTGNVGATGTVNGGVVNATTGFNLGGSSFAFGSVANDNAFLGFSGNSTMTGKFNASLGVAALQLNTTGFSNTATGYESLAFNTTGTQNTATGTLALASNDAGSGNTADGDGALELSTGSNNTAIGGFAFLFNSTGTGNSALGYFAGVPTVNNTFTTGTNDTYVGIFANSGNQVNLSNATAIGALAQVTASNAMVLGSINGVNGATADTSVGIGTTAPAARLDVHGNANFTGPITFAPGQTFPGTGTITGVTAGTDLIGGGSSGSVTLNVDTTKVVTAVTAGTDLTGGGAGGVLTLNLDTTKVPQLSGGNFFTGNQTISGDVSSNNLVLPQTLNSVTGVIAVGSSSIHVCCSSGAGNIFVGQSAGNFTTTGGGNTGVGRTALQFDTTGQGNTAIGDAALASNSSGQFNTVVGRLGLFSNTTGQSNTSVGVQALQTNTTGGSNTAVGLDALSFSTGDSNTAVGTVALGANSTGSRNTGLGDNAGNTTNGASTTGSSNTFVGAETNPGTQTTLSNATAIGANAQVTASNAMVLGSIKGVNGASADALVGIGTTAPAFKLDVHGNANFTGPITFAPGQTFPGTGTVTGVTAGTDLTGGGTGGVLTINLDTTKVPQLATANTFASTQTISNGDLSLNNGNLDLPSGGVVNSGGRALIAVSSANANTSVGLGAANPNAGDDNTSLGKGALQLNVSGRFNTATGSLALGANSTGSQNTADGGEALETNSSGSNNAAVGAGAMELNTTGSNNTSVGFGALEFNSVSNSNTAVGVSAGNPTNFGSTTGSNNTFLGANTNPATQLNLSNATAIGANAQVTASNSMVLGSINGVNGATANTNVGIGTTAPTTTLDVRGTGDFVTNNQTLTVGNVGCNSGFVGIAFGSSPTCGAVALVGNGTDTILNRKTGGTLAFRENNANQMSIATGGAVTINGDLHVVGALSKGSGSFKIDHPLDPLNKYLYHSFVESPDMMDVYNGNVVTNTRGAAVVALPDYFDALNRDFRYQLTVIGQFAQAIVAKEISGNHFTIKTSKPGVKVSWQVTGIRQDPYANMHRIAVEEEKSKEERGSYLHPDAYEKEQATVAALP